MGRKFFPTSAKFAWEFGSLSPVKAHGVDARKRHNINPMQCRL